MSRRVDDEGSPAVADFLVPPRCGRSPGFCLDSGDGGADADVIYIPK